MQATKSYREFLLEFADYQLAYEAGGGSAIYTKNPLQRQFRDAHVVTHHLMVSKTATTLAGRVLLGVESDTTML